MCVYTFKYMCVYIHTHTHTQVYICIPAYMYTNKYMGMCVSVYIYMYIYISARPYESCKNVKGLAPLRCTFGTGTTVVQIISTRP